MHLLDTKTKQLKTFYGKAIPKYAILSHMWGAEEDEVLFRHISRSDADRREGEMRKGYAKIEGACKQAVEDGWEYIWIDTCCIDKRSSAELSEAINSMYEWYRNSEVCYVYLEDVQIGGDGQVKSDEDAIFPSVPFENSRWFSRGWTLQELIAPRYVVFYSRDWVDIGTKTGPLRDTISAVTRVRAEMLTAYDPRRASVAEKMSWAAFRETTRAEDSAYCLMGLLGVNMPLLYGEGDRAFRRLQEEIMKVSDDDSVFAWKARLDDYNYPDNTRGMLAASPWDFRDGMDIVQSKDGAYSPYSMTNQGLQIKLPLLPIDIVGIDSRNIFKTTLKCTIRKGNPHQWIVIYLQKIGEGCYQRIFPHWLDHTEVNPNDTGINELTSLLVPQVDAPTAHYQPEFAEVRIKILPTVPISSFTINGDGLIGYDHSYTVKYDHHKLIYFKHPELKNSKEFGLVIGLYEGIPWLDFIDDTEKWSYEYFNGLYKEGSQDRSNVKAHLDWLSEQIPGRDWWVTVSVRKTGHSSSCFRVIIDIHEVPRERYIPSVMSVGDSFDGKFPGNLDHHNIRYPDFKKESRDWFALFNPKVERALDVGLLYTLRHDSLVYCIEFSYDGKYLATGGNMVRVYDIKAGIEIYIFFDESSKTARDPYGIHSICFSPDGKFLATGDTGGSIKLWEIGEKCIHRVFNGYRSPVDFLCFSPDSCFIISGLKGGTVWVWGIDNGTPRILTMRLNYNHRMSVAISPDSRLVAAGSSVGNIQVRDIVTAQLFTELRERGDCVCMAFTPDQKGLVTGSTDKTLKYWDVSESVPTRIERTVEDLSDSGTSSKFAEGDDRTTQRIKTFEGHKDSVNSVAISHDGHWMASGSKDGSVLFWDLRNTSAQFMLKTRSIHLLNMSPVDNILVTISDDGSVRVWRYDSFGCSDTSYGS